MIRSFSPNRRNNGSSFMEVRTRGIPAGKEVE
ncbi:hypothetical protein J2W97_001896 [Paenibacillus jamilae]|jgi:hypothetical protein|nr:hypothetical protein [Paenibacillus jamilae]SPY22169.1 Uncharacterised protein [Paenibacillus polymyxa]